MNFPSTFDIGDRVAVRFDGGENDGTCVFGYIRAVIFSSSKVWYSIVVFTGQPEGSLTPEQLQERLTWQEESENVRCVFTLHNVDSCLVHPAPGKPIDLGVDLYS